MTVMKQDNLLRRVFQKLTAPKPSKMSNGIGNSSNTCYKSDNGFTARSLEFANKCNPSSTRDLRPKIHTAGKPKLMPGPVQVPVVYLTQQPKAATERKHDGKSGKRKQASASRTRHSALGYVSKRGGQARLTSAPSSFGLQSFGPKFTFAGPPQKEADQDWRYGTKLKGREIWVNPITTGAAGTTGCINSLFSAYVNALGMFATGSRPLNVMRLYGFFAFRKIKLTYIPLVGVNTVGLFSFGFLENNDATTRFAAAGPTGLTVSQLEDSSMFSVWAQEGSIDYTYKGIRTFSTIKIGATPAEDNIQATIFGCRLGANDNGTYGYMQLDYELDLYSPMTDLPNLADPKPLPSTASVTLKANTAAPEEQKNETTKPPALVSYVSPATPASTPSGMWVQVQPDYNHIPKPLPPSRSSG